MCVSIIVPFRKLDQFSAVLVRATFTIACLLIVCSPAKAAPDANKQPPTFEVVAGALGDYFTSLRDHRPGDLVSQSSVAAALEHVANATGWEAPDQKAIVGRALADNSFLITQLSTPAGRSFMRTVAKYPGSYPRLDRLSTISHGQQFIKDLINRKGGSEMIEYLTTTRGGRELGKMMSGVQHGVDLNKPTGRIYTASDLLAEVNRAYTTKP